ncbi:hypothetical protein SALBM311S_04185 [Streptomyces alboniger]
MQPPRFCTGSAMSMATVSGPSTRITASSSASRREVNVSSSTYSGARPKRLVLDTNRVSIAGGPYGSVRPGSSVSDRVPMVRPW